MTLLPQVTLDLERTMDERRRLSADAWGEVLAQFEGSPLTVEEFCQQRGISLDRLKHWQRKLRRVAGGKAVKRPEVSSAPQERAGFLDLGALEPRGAPLVLRLDFGGGVVLQLTRH